jgi:hypothetical protein
MYLLHSRVTSSLLGQIFWSAHYSQHSQPASHPNLAANKPNKITITQSKGGPGSSVGIATGYGMDGSGIEFRWGRDFPHLPRTALGPTQPSVQWVSGLSRE